MKRLCLVLTPIYTFYHTRPVPTVERENGSGKFVKRIEKQAFQSYCLVLNLITQFFKNIVYMPFCREKVYFLNSKLTRNL